MQQLKLSINTKQHSQLKTSDSSMNKKELRKAIKAKVAQLTNEEKNLEAISVFNHIEKSDIFKKSKNIMLFSSLPDEIPTHHTID